MKYAKVEYIDFSNYKRVIAVSDLHGDNKGFLNVLKKVGFSQDDALVIVGDILEKGTHFLELLRNVMNFVWQGNVYMVAGNNDILFTEWYSDEVSDEDVLYYMNSRRNSVLIEMANELNLPYQTVEDISLLKARIQTTYQKEIDFLNSLPHIIESDIATFVHAGIKPGSLEEQDYEYCLTAKAFANEQYYFEKPVVVGHWPASNYCDKIVDVRVYHNPKTNIICIDGGNSMKNWQQINYLIFQDGEMQSGFYDNLPKVRVLENQEENEDPVSLIFSNTRIEIREEQDKTSICYIPYLDRKMEIDNDRIYQYKGNMYCYDFTTYHLPVKAGEIVSYCEESKAGILVKRDGIVGEYAGRFEFMEE